MAKFCRIEADGEVLANKAKYCDTFLSRGLGLMFSKGAAVLVDSKERILSIHMMFVFQPLDIIWLDKDKRIVDCKRVKPFTMFHRPKKKAKYVVELPVCERKYSVGEIVHFSKTNIKA